MAGEHPRVDPKEVEVTFDAAIRVVSDLQGRLLEGARNIGYVRESLERAKP